MTKTDMGMEQNGASRSKTANTNLAKDATKTDWGSIRNLGSFIRRKSSKSGTKTAAPQITTSISGKLSPRIAAEEKAAQLEKQFAELRKQTGEEISELERKIASRDSTLRRRAVAMQEAEEKIGALETQLNEAIEKEAQIEELKSEWATKEKQFQVREQEVEKIVSDNRRRPVIGLLRTVLLAGTGAVIASKTAAN